MYRPTFAPKYLFSAADASVALFTQWPELSDGSPVVRAYTVFTDMAIDVILPVELRSSHLLNSDITIMCEKFSEL